MTELEILCACLEYSTLRTGEREAFEGWRDYLQGGERRRLTSRQRTWLNEVAERLEVITGAANLWSGGGVPRGREVAAPGVLLHRPLKPPGATRG